MAIHYPIGRAVHDAEERGIHFLVSQLPDKYVVYSNVELPTGRPMQTYEHDAVVLAPHAVFTIELKSWGGVIKGNRDRWQLDDGTIVQAPINLQQSKARILKGSLAAAGRGMRDVWVQGLVFLSAADARPDLSGDWADFVKTRADLIRTLTDPAELGLTGRTLSAEQFRAVDTFVRGGSVPKTSNRLGHFRLLERLAAESRPYDVWLAEESHTGQRRILHVHTIVGERSADREQSRNRAMREATLASRLRGGEDILRYDAYLLTDTDPQHIVLQYEDTTPLVPLRSWVRDQRPGLTARLQVAQRIARALHFVHGRELVHRQLEPDAVLVSPEPSPLQVRLCAFDLVRDLAGQAQTITSRSFSGASFLCAAPETIRTGEATPRSDLFSFGVLLYELLTERPLFATIDDILRPFSLPPVHVGDRPVPEDLRALLDLMLAPLPAQRPESAEFVAQQLDEIVRAERLPAPRRELATGDLLRDVYRLERPLGRGATSTTWLASQIQVELPRVLKIADASQAEALQEEGRILELVHHRNLVRAFGVEQAGDRMMLVLALADGVSGALWAEAGDPMGPSQIRGLVRGLLGAVEALHSAGYLHRDIKPANIILAEPSAEPTLIDLGLAAPLDREGDLAVGTVKYKDPLVYDQGRWSPANDQYAAFLSIYEILTGVYPFGSSTPDAGHPPTIETGQLPDTLDERTAEKLADVFRRALHRSPGERPASIAEALAQVDAALAGRQTITLPAVSPEPEPPTAVASVDPETPITDLALSTRARGALMRLRIETVGQFVALNVAQARSLPNVGRKTWRELESYQAALLRQLPGGVGGGVVPLRPGNDRFYPHLTGDPRAIEDLGSALTPAVRRGLRDLGLFTIGELVVAPSAVLESLPGMGPGKLARIRRALDQLAGIADAPHTLAELDARLQDELKTGYRTVAALLGLSDGRARTASEAREALGVTRQHIHQTDDLTTLQAEASAAHHLVELALAALPGAGLARVEAVAEALERRLPLGDTDAELSYLGYARLAALLIHGVERAHLDPAVRVAMRQPWTMPAFEAASGALGATVNWPPRPRTEVDPAVWDALDETMQRALVRWGADAAQVVDAVMRIDSSIQVDATGGVYRAPVSLAQALALLRPRLEASGTLHERVAAARAAYPQLVGDEDPDAAAEAAGYVRAGTQILDPARVQPPEPEVRPTVDPTIPREQLGADQPPLVRALVASARTGGFRVVALPPARHHALAGRLVELLREAVGGAPVRYVDVDRVLIDALKAADLWDYALAQDDQEGADWSWAAPDLAEALDQQVAAQARPGTVTVLGQPALLGRLDLMHWLSGFYDRARGGRHGLVVLAIPGGIHDNRVRLNERYNLPYTPDMAAVYLDHETAR